MQTETKIMTITDPILKEIGQEAEITKRLLDIVPEDKLGWRPHPKARTLGALAMHIATLQGSVAELGQPEIADVSQIPPDSEPTGREQILEAFDKSTRKAKDIIGSTDDARARAEWKITSGGETLMAVPRTGFWRSILLNHYYHHRGQLSAYLRELDVPLPSIYGPSADSNHSS